MKQVMQTIKNLLLFLFGIVMIVTGYKVNDAQAEAKAEAAKAKARTEEARMQEAAERARVAEETAQAKVRTTVEKAQPEKASASQYKNKKDKWVKKP